VRINTKNCIFEDIEDGLAVKGSNLREAFIRKFSFGCEIKSFTGRSSIQFISNNFHSAGTENEEITISTSLGPGKNEENLQASLKVRPFEEEGGLLISLALTNISDVPINILRIIPIYCDARSKGSVILGHQPGEWTFFKMGWQSWSATRSFSTYEYDRSPRLKFLREMEENPENKAAGKPGIFVSEQMTIIKNLSSGQTFGCGFISSKKGFGDIKLDVSGKIPEFKLLEASYHLDGIPLEPGSTVESEPLWLNFAPSSIDLAERWAILAGKAMKARVHEHAPVGWCSWYYYYTKINEEQMVENLEKLAALKERLCIELIQLDDGYQTQIGDWLESNQKFPSGIPVLLKKIAEKDFTTGIWTAPFLARPKSRLFQDHPDWFLKNHKGMPRSGGINPLWGGRVYALDPTHPEAQKYLFDVFSTMRNEWKADFFKIDFCYAAALPAFRHDPNSTRASALRLGLETIREAIGDAYLLGCGCPLAPAVGIVDAMRIGSDVTPKWENKLMKSLLSDDNCLGTRHALRNILTRSFLHGRFWVNDPDCLMIRRKKNKLTDDEVIAMASVYAVTGGMILLSDDMSLVDEDRLELAARTIRLRTRGGRAPELMKSGFPETVISKTEKGYLLLVANWKAVPCQRILDLAEILSQNEIANIRKVSDIWTGEEMVLRDSLIRFGNIPRHGVKLLEIIIPWSNR